MHLGWQLFSSRFTTFQLQKVWVSFPFLGSIFNIFARNWKRSNICSIWNESRPCSVMQSNLWLSLLLRQLSYQTFVPLVLVSVSGPKRFRSSTFACQHDLEEHSAKVSCFWIFMFAKSVLISQQWFDCFECVVTLLGAGINVAINSMIFYVKHFSYCPLQQTGPMEAVAFWYYTCLRCLMSLVKQQTAWCAFQSTYISEESSVFQFYVKPMSLFVLSNGTW